MAQSNVGRKVQREFRLHAYRMPEIRHGDEIPVTIDVDPGDVEATVLLKLGERVQGWHLVTGGPHIMVLEVELRGGCWRPVRKWRYTQKMGLQEERL